MSHRPATARPGRAERRPCPAPARTGTHHRRAPARQRPARLLATLLALASAAGWATAAEHPPPPVPQPRFEDAEIVFEGNATLWGFTLRRQLADLAGRPLSLGTAADAAFLLETYYRERGFPYARVHAELRPVPGDKPVVRLRIVEGPRPAVRRVELRGLPTELAERARDVLRYREHRWYEPHYLVEAELRTATRRLERMLRDAGWLQARAGARWELVELGQGAIVRFDAVPGARHRIAAVEVRGARTRAPAELLRLAALPPGVAAEHEAIEQARRRVEEHYREQGRPFARCRARLEPLAAPAATPAVRVVLAVEEGPLVEYGQLRVQGNEVTAAGLVRSCFSVEPGALVRASALQHGERTLYELGLFTRVHARLEPAAGEGSTRRADVVVELQERPAGWIRLGGGWGSYELLRGQLALGYANLFGIALQGEVRALGSMRGWRYDAALSHPRMLPSGLSSRLEAFYEDRDVRVFDLLRRGLRLRLEQPLASRVRLRAFAETRLERSRVTDLDSGTLLERESIEILSQRLGLLWDGRDDALDPQRGLYATVSVEEAGFALLRDVRFSRIYGSAAWHWTPHPRATLALFAAAGFIFPHQGRQVPLQERWFTGGEASVRAFEEREIGEPLGGLALLRASAELRLRLLGPLGAVAFWDAGEVAPQPGALRLDALRHGVGCGARFATPLGPLRLDVAWKLRRRPGEDPLLVHFSIGHPF